LSIKRNRLDILLVKVAERQTSWVQSMQFPSAGELRLIHWSGKKARSLEFNPGSICPTARMELPEISGGGLSDPRQNIRSS
jgi:hypothetical protein